MEQTEPREWTLSRFADGSVCRAIGPDESSSAVERVTVVELEPILDMIEGIANSLPVGRGLDDQTLSFLRAHGRLTVDV